MQNNGLQTRGEALIEGMQAEALRAGMGNA